MEPNNLPLRPVETQRASEAIYEQIKGIIISGQLKPGDRLPSERNMMEMLQRSRPTIREALRMLERAGFIRTVPGTNGAIVQEYSIRNVEDPLSALLQINSVTVAELAEYRMQNESAVVRWAAARRTEEDLAALEEIQTQTRALIDAREYEKVPVLDPCFHKRLAMAAKNKVSCIMTQVYSNIVKDTVLASMQQRTEPEQKATCERALNMHQSVLDAVRAGDEEAAERAMRRHVQAFRTLLDE